MDSEVPPIPGAIGQGKKRDRKQMSPAKVIVIGLSHKTASVDVREKLAVQEHDWQKAAHQLIGLPSIKEAVPPRNSSPQLSVTSQAFPRLTACGTACCGACGRWRGVLTRMRWRRR